MAAEGTPYTSPHGSPKAGDADTEAAAAAASCEGVPAGATPGVTSGQQQQQQRPSSSGGTGQPGSSSPPSAQANPSSGGGFGGKDVEVAPLAAGGAFGGKPSPQNVFAAAALAATAAAKTAAVVKDPRKQQQELEAELAVLQELMVGMCGGRSHAQCVSQADESHLHSQCVAACWQGDSVQGADIYKRMPLFTTSMCTAFVGCTSVTHTPCPGDLWPRSDLYPPPPSLPSRTS